MLYMKLGLKGVKYFGTSQNFACTLVYQMRIEIYDQISIIRNYSKVKLLSCVFTRVGLKGGQNSLERCESSCMLVYLMGIQIYDQVSILRSWSKGKLHRAVLLGFGLKELKITVNIMKVGEQSYLPNAHLNL